MSWSQVSEHRWERPSDGMESYFVFLGNLSSSLCDGRHHCNIFSRIQVDIHVGSDDEKCKEDALRRAWKQLRYEQPQIASTIDGFNKVYEVPADEAALDAWLTATFVVSCAADGDDLSRKVDPIQQATLYYLPRSSELVLRAHHTQIDGIGTLMLWDAFLSGLTSPRQGLKFGDEPSRLAPSLEKVLGHPEPPHPELAEKGAKLLASCVGAMPGIGPVSRIGTAPSGASRSLELVVPTRTTGAIIQACKAKDITVTSAVHAAYIRTLMAHADPKGKQSEYVSVSSFNSRSFLPIPYSTSRYAFSVYSQPWPLTIPLDGQPCSFIELSRTLNTYYKTTFRDNPEAHEVSGSLTWTLRDMVQTPEFLTSPVSRDALVSSLGITEEYLKRNYRNSNGDVDVTVQNLKFGIEVVLGQSMLFIYTFRERLRLGYCFNDGFEEPLDIQSYLNSIQKVLVEELLA